VEFEDGGFTDLTIYNNTFAGGWNWGMHFTTEGNPVRGLTVHNNAFRGMTGLNVEPVIASESSIQLAIAKYYTGSSEIDIFDAAFAVA